MNSVQEGSDTGTFVFGTKKFNDITLFGSMLEILLKKLQLFNFVREEGKESPSYYSIVFTEEFNEEQSKLLVDKLLLNGSACVFYNDKEIRTPGLILWAMAMKIREKMLFLNFVKSSSRLRRRKWRLNARKKSAPVLKSNIFCVNVSSTGMYRLYLSLPVYLKSMKRSQMPTYSKLTSMLFWKIGVAEKYYRSRNLKMHFYLWRFLRWNWWKKARALKILC